MATLKELTDQLEGHSNRLLQLKESL